MLHSFYSQDLDEKKKKFRESLLRLLTKQIKELAWAGQDIPLQVQKEMQSLVILNEQSAEAYKKIIQFENFLRL